MKAELRSLGTPEGEPLESVRPRSDEFCIRILAYIGAEGQAGEDMFQFEVCSTAWLIKEADSQPAFWGGRRLVVRRFDPQTIEAQVRKRLQHAVGTDWKSVAQKVGAWATWEFEGYES